MSVLNITKDNFQKEIIESEKQCFWTFGQAGADRAVCYLRLSMKLQESGKI